MFEAARGTRERARRARTDTASARPAACRRLASCRRVVLAVQALSSWLIRKRQRLASLLAQSRNLRAQEIVTIGPEYTPP